MSKYGACQSCLNSATRVEDGVPLCEWCACLLDPGEVAAKRALGAYLAAKFPAARQPTIQEVPDPWLDDD